MDKLMKQRSDYDLEVSETAAQLLKEARAVGDDCLLGHAYYYEAEVYCMYTYDVAKFKRNIIIAMEYLQKSDEQMQLGKCYNLLGIDSLLRGNMALGLDYLLTALHYCSETDENNLRGILYSNIAHIYGDMHDYREGLRYVRLSLSVLKQFPEDPLYIRDMILCYVMQGNFYLQLGKNTNQYLKKAESALHHMQLLEKKNGKPLDYYDHFVILDLQIRVLHHLGQFEARDAVIAEMLQSSRNFQGVADMIEDICSLGHFLLGIGDHATVEQLLLILAPSLNSLNVSNILIQIVELQIAYFACTGQDNERLEATSRYYELSQAMKITDASSYKFSVDVRQSMEEMRVKQEEMEKENLRLLRQADFDQLTGLPNRYHLSRYSDQAFETAYNEKTLLAVEILDIDFFKEYNDTFGHQAGDEVLRNIAAQIRRLCQEHPGVYAARYGGDEFMILYKEKTDAEVHALSEQLREYILALKIKHPASEQGILTISQGIRNSIPTPENKLWDYMYTADAALYNIKQNHKGGISLLHSSKAASPD